MTEQNSGHNFNKEELPIPIPPVDQAWQSMQQKLDAELPAEGNLPRSSMRHIWIKSIVIVTTVATITTAFWLYNRKHNKVNNTDLVVSSHDIQADSLSDTVLQQSSSTTISSISGEQSDTVNNNPLSVSSSSSKSLPSSLQSAEPALLQPSVASKLYPAEKNTGRSIAGHQTASRQLSQSPAPGKQYPAEHTNALVTTEQETTDQQSSQSLTTDGKDPAEKTMISAQQTTNKRQLPTKLNTYKTDRSAEETVSHQPLQLTMIQMPFVKSHTGLQHKADLLVLRQISNKEREKKWALYVQLNVPIPLSGDSTYFMGPNGKDQVYRSLIPALRVERKLWKGALSLDIQPAVSAALKSDIPKKDSGITWFPYDTVRTFLKQYGWGLALQYQVHIRDKWQLGAGIQTSFYRKAVIYQKVSDSSGYATSGIYPASPADKQDLSKVRFSGMAELNYVAGKWQLGLRTLVPITRVSKTRDISTKPLNIEFIIRRRLWTK